MRLSLAAPTLLFAVLVFAVFVVPILPGNWQDLIYRGLYTVIFFMSALSIERHRRAFLIGAVVLTVVGWVAESIGDVADNLSSMLNIGFFAVMVFNLIMQIARQKRVDSRIITGALNAYLLLGLAFSLLVALIDVLDPGAISFVHDIERGSILSDHIYYAFVTMTTVGYGDVVPVAPYARSLAILAGVAGQMYIAIVIALLVSKLPRSADRG